MFSVLIKSELLDLDPPGTSFDSNQSVEPLDPFP